MRGGKRNNAGRPNGSRSRSTIEIKTLLDETIDFEKLVKKFYELTINDGNAVAGRILMEYRFGKPSQKLDVELQNKYDGVEVTIIHNRKELEELRARQAKEEKEKRKLNDSERQ